MTLLEEHWISGELWRGFGHVRLTATTFTCSVILMRWMLARIPVSTMRDVQLHQHLLRDEVRISYLDAQTALRMLSFSTGTLAGWGNAFARLGVKVAVQA